MKKLLIVFGLCLFFSTNLEAAEMDSYLETYISYDDVNSCIIQDGTYLGDEVIYTTYENSVCLASIDILNQGTNDDENGNVLGYYYTQNIIYFTEAGMIYEEEFNVAESESSTATREDLTFNNTEVSTYEPPILVEELGTITPTTFNSWYMDEEGIVTFTQDRIKAHVVMTNLDGVKMFEIFVGSYPEDYTTACTEGDEELHLFSAGDYPVEEYSQKFYDENGVLAGEYIINFELNTDCNVSDEMKMTSSNYYEYYPNGQPSYVALETYENGEIITSSEVYYDENGNIINQDEIDEPIDTPEVIPVDSEEIPTVKEVTPVVEIPVVEIDEPVVTTGVEQVDDTKKLVETGSNVPKVLGLSILIGALFLVRKFL